MRRVAAFAAAVLCVSSAASVARAQDNLSYARQHFRRGTELYESGRYDEALAEFRTSQDLYASPNSRLFIARSLRELGRLAEAVSEFERALGEADERARTDPRYAATRESARTELAAVEPRVGRLRVTLSPAADGARVWVAGREIPPAALGLSLPVMPGRVEVAAEAPGRQRARREVEVPAGRVASVDLAMVAAPAWVERPPPGTAPAPVAPAAPAGEGASGTARALGWTAVGVGGAGLASFVVFWVLADGQFRRLMPMCRAGCPSQEGEIATGELYQTLTNVSLGVGLGAAAVGTLVLVVAGRDPGRAAPVRVGVTGTGVVVGGTF